jgi:hypothetical protein
MKPNKLPRPNNRAPVLNVHRARKMARSAQAYVCGSTLKFYEWLEAQEKLMSAKWTLRCAIAGKKSFIATDQNHWLLPLALVKRGGTHCQPRSRLLGALSEICDCGRVTRILASFRRLGIGPNTRDHHLEQFHV